MSITVEVTVSDELSTDDGLPDSVLLQTWAEAAYLNTSPALASMLIATENEIQELNKQYRDKDKVTNVLSFPMELPEEIDPQILGDIVLCANVIRQEAIDQSKSEKSHWAHMVVHSMLHLQGFDHMQNNEAEEMEKLEIKILHQLGFDNPY